MDNIAFDTFKCTHDFLFIFFIYIFFLYYSSVNRKVLLYVSTEEPVEFSVWSCPLQFFEGSKTKSDAATMMNISTHKRWVIFLIISCNSIPYSVFEIWIIATFMDISMKCSEFANTLVLFAKPNLSNYPSTRLGNFSGILMCLIFVYTNA